MRYGMAALTLALGLATFAIPSTATAQGLTVTNITGDLLNLRGRDVGDFEGTLTNVVFSNADGVIVATGSLTADVFDRNGNFMRTVTGPVSTLVTDIGTAEPEPGNCQVLFLQLGPIELNLLGLELFVDQITVDLEADPAGGILGQLLCALADGLGLDLGDLIDDLFGGGLLGDLVQEIVDLLNDILGGLTLSA